MELNTKSFLNQIVKVKMDRPLGVVHPKHGFIYPVNYGYIPGTVSGDGFSGAGVGAEQAEKALRRLHPLV